ncbi:uncharacterized protein LOC143531634 [Bidens hawaiensis]|uniref:uncharacterized protein LOC143531634 n=1 Tax=Bidens hawaiensis TaxID=980011 RepID=UPI00404B061E
MPPRRKARKVTKQPASSQLNNSQSNVDSAVAEDNTFPDQEVEHQCAALRMLRDVEIERLRSDIRLLKSSISKEKGQTLILKFFEENLPNLTVSRTDISEPIEVKWKDKDDDISMTAADGGSMMPYILQQMALANPEFSSLGGFDFSCQTGRTSLIDADNLQIKDFVCILSL